MIPAKKFPLGAALVWWLIRTSLRKHFDNVYLRMRTERSVEQQALPMIICANHSTWWDGYVAALIQHQLRLDGYLMMEEAQLRRYFFFAWLGCFSVNRQNARSAIQSLQYAARLLKERPGRMVWIFPQGEIAPNDRRPLVFFSGVAHLARMVRSALIYPAAIRIEYRAEQRPDLFISLGEPWRVSEEDLQAPAFVKECTQRLEASVTAELEQLHDDVTAANFDDFTRIMHGKSSTNRVFDAFLLRKPMQRQ